MRDMKLAVITGASSGIGAATARELAAHGHRVVLVARQRDKLDAIAAAIGEHAIVEPCDASDGAAVMSMAERVLGRHGVPDVIINAAGAGEWKLIEETSPAEAITMMEAPYFAAFNITHGFMKPMLARRSGVFVHVGSPASIFPWPSSTGYAAARWALRGLHEALCQDLSGTGLRSCHVVFGRVASSYFENNPGAQEKIPRIANTIRTLTPEECARIIAQVVERPQRQLVFPLMLRAYLWTYSLMPWLVRALLRWTGARRRLSPH
jgi:NADP-dependent 3-hydroxy acid dehydrogenase YdfG